MTRVRPSVMRSLWRADFRMLKNTLIGGVSRDNAFVQQWPESGSRDIQGLNRHNFFNTCLNEVSEEFINIYVKHE